MTTRRIRDIENGLILCWALAAFDLVLGTIACLFPGYYADLMHPYLPAPQLDLVRRMGAFWLAMGAVAAIAATTRPARRPVWFTVVAVFRLVEVPADVVYVSVAEGSSTVSELILWACPAINLFASWFLYRCAWQLECARAGVSPAPDDANAAGDAGAAS